MAAPPRVQEFDPEYVRDISEAVYRERLGSDDLAKLLAEKDGEKRLRSRATAYDSLTRSYLRAIKVKDLLG